MIIKEEIQELDKRKKELYLHVDIQQKKIKIKELEHLSQQNNFWGNPKKAKNVLKQF